MNGPEHYREAERLVGPRTTVSIPSGTTRMGPPTTDMILQAQVHAILALAAATALGSLTATDDGMGAYDEWAWVEVATADPDASELATEHLAKNGREVTS